MADPQSVADVWDPNRPRNRYDKYERHHVDGQPVIQVPGVKIYDTQTQRSYVSDGRTWVEYTPTLEPEDIPPEPILRNCPGCETDAVIPDDDYVCGDCRAQGSIAQLARAFRS